MSLRDRLKAFAAHARAFGPSEAIRHLLEPLLGIEALVSPQHAQLLLTAACRLEQLSHLPAQPLAAHEMSVFSQAGEDGIIQNLVRHLPCIPEIFIEFGVEDYTEANTRYLLLSDYWQGLIIDGSEAQIARIRSSKIYWQRNLQARQLFIDRDNIMPALEGFREAGLLSIDIDGNDYWVWEAIDFQPWIVICEYNSLFGPTAKISIPYNSKFQRVHAHYSNLYFGCSLNALCHLAQKKGYVFVGCNRMGSNAFFVRRDVSRDFRTLSAEEGFVLTPSRQSRNTEGKLDYLNALESMELIASLPVVDVENGTVLKLADLPLWLERPDSA